MPKETFYHLPEEKRERILAVLKEEFEEKPFSKANVKSIVEKLDIARGSFYQYFEDLEDSYFTILDRETEDIHLLFMNIFIRQDADLHRSLELYGERIADLLFRKESYALYKHRYLYWNEALNRHWNQFRRRHEQIFQIDAAPIPDYEKMHFIKAVVHSLILRSFQEQWTKELFLSKYQQHIHWIKKGVN